MTRSEKHRALKLVILLYFLTIHISTVYSAFKKTYLL